MVKDGCNNAERQRILKLHDGGELSPEEIARGLHLTLRIVKNIIWYSREGGKEEKEAARAALLAGDTPATTEAKPEPEAKPEKVKKKASKKKASKKGATAAKEFE